MPADSHNEAWYTIHDIDKLDSPALVVYPDRVKENINLLIRRIDDRNRLRPHVKTHKTREVTALLLDAGIKKFKCATIAEAEMLAITNAPDVMLAYQSVGPKVARFISLIKKYPDTAFSCLVDNAMAAQSLSEAAILANVMIPVYIDLNVGMNRTGIAPDEKAVRLYQFCAGQAGIMPLGLHVYDGHITDADFEKRTKQCDAAFASVEIVKHALIKKGFAEPNVVAGGSATFPVHAKRMNVECSPGTFVYWDAGYLRQLPEQTFLPAALVVSRIISLPTERLICTDLGHKAVASENVLNRRVHFINAPNVTFIAHSEEHLILDAGEDHSFKIGDVLYGIPVHICPTCALYERAAIVENKMLATEWKIIARDRKLFV